MRKPNILYLFWFLALGLFLYLLFNLRTQVTKTIFGTATTQVYSMNVEYNTLVEERRVQPGDHVKTGDTLLVLIRAEMDKNISDLNDLMHQVETDRNSKNLLVDKEEQLFIAQQAARKKDLESQISVMEKELEMQINLLKSIGKSQTTSTNLKEIQLAALKEALRQLDVQSQKQQEAYTSQRATNNNMYETRVSAFKNDIRYYELEKYKMTVIAPCDGLIENVFVLPKDPAPAYKELVRINSFLPNRVTGFVHETMSIPFHIGDTVNLLSVARPEITCRGVILGNGNHLVELPLRLRKFVELRAWGREVYVGMEPNNGFYIDEKILIQMK